MTLEKEYEAFEKDLPNLLEQGYEGRWTVYKKRERLGIWHCEEDALEAAWRKYGNQPFLCEQITEHKKPVQVFSAKTEGIECLV